MQRMNVVLPEPDGADDDDDLPAPLTVSETPLRTWSSAEPLLDVGRLDDDVGRR